MLQRLAACIEYSGVKYSGWQLQKNASSVQEQVEKAIGQVANHAVRVVTAGRTDTGVHGIGQIIHFDTDSQRKPVNWLHGVNTALPHDISLIWTHPVPSDFHARFDARKRHYRYVLLNRGVSPSTLHGLVTWHRPKLDLQRMQQAAALLIGRHDFSGYRASRCQSKSPVKTLIKLDINQQGDWFWFDFTADGFLHHMVRNILGVLCPIGEGRFPVSWASEILESRDRKRAGKTHSPHGLYFAKVEYDPAFGLPEPPPVCRFW